MFRTRRIKKSEVELGKILDDIEFKNSWRRRMKSDFLRNMNEEKALFVARCMSENLSHARHVENERITFNSVFMAMTAGAMAFASVTDSDHFAAGCLTLGMLIACMIAWKLTVRWSNAFDRYLHYAKECYIILYKYYFRPFNKRRKKLYKGQKFLKCESVTKTPRIRTENPPEDKKKRFIWEQSLKEKVEGLRDSPLYCFKIRNPIHEYRSSQRVFLTSTRTLYHWFYFVVMAMLFFSLAYCIYFILKSKFEF